MKKLISLFTGLVLVTGIAFADDAKPKEPSLDLENWRVFGVVTPELDKLGTVNARKQFELPVANCQAERLSTSTEILRARVIDGVVSVDGLHRYESSPPERIKVIMITPAIERQAGELRVPLRRVALRAPDFVSLIQSRQSSTSTLVAAADRVQRE